MPGMPSRGIGYVSAADPGTRLLLCAPTGGWMSGGRFWLSIPVPITRRTFSSRVIAAMTSSIGLLPSWGADEVVAGVSGAAGPAEVADPGVEHAAAMARAAAPSSGVEHGRRRA